MIGPNTQVKQPNDLFELFNENGVVQGVFMANGTARFISHIVETEKRIYEDKYGSVKINLMNLSYFKFMEKIGMGPNILGLANTALLQVPFNQTKILALNERDLPYEIDINQKNQTIKTVGRLKIPFIRHFSAHSKVIDDTIETIDYSTSLPLVFFYKIKKNMTQIDSSIIWTKYISMIHDFATTNESIIIGDLPMTINFNIYEKPYSILKMKSCLKPRFLVLSKETSKVYQVKSDHSFYFFHFGKVKENQDTIEMYLPMYDEFAFTNPFENKGRYRRIIINKSTREMKIEKNPILENYSVDFPISYGEYTVLVIPGGSTLIMVKDLEFIEEINLEGNLYGEPSIKDDKLFCFTYCGETNFFNIYDLKTKNHTKFELPVNISIGFHSIFL